MVDAYLQAITQVYKHVLRYADVLCVSMEEQEQLRVCFVGEVDARDAATIFFRNVYEVLEASQRVVRALRGREDYGVELHY